MFKRSALFVAVSLAWVVCPLWADDWGAPEPTSFHSRGFGYVAEIFPPKSRQNSSDKPLCYFYEMAYTGTTWKIDARLKWKAPLINDPMPYQAVVSMDGDLVTLNDYGNLGYANAVVIYDKKGKLVRTYRFDELVPKGDMDKFDSSESSRWWTKNAKYYFLTGPSRLYIVLPWGKVMEFFLKNGKFKYGVLAQFPDLSKVTKRSFPNEEAEIWQISLRFSSITDVLDARAKAK